MNPAVFGFTLALTAVVAPAGAWACSCAPEPRSLSQAFENDHLIFSGETIAEEVVFDGRSKKYTFDVDAVWKGLDDTPETIDIYTATNGAMCGAYYTIGEDSVVYAYRVDMNEGTYYRVSSCSQWVEPQDGELDALGLPEDWPQANPAAGVGR